jgi:hypothetical protein
LDIDDHSWVWGVRTRQGCHVRFGRTQGRRTLADVAVPRRARHEAAPVRITTAPTSHHEDIDRRRRRYLFSMAIRTMCFVGAVAVGPGWFRWVLVVGAFILPYIAVVMANSASPRIEGADLVQPDPRYKELGE